MDLTGSNCDMTNIAHSTEQHAWEKWLPMWHGLFYILLIITTPMAVFDSEQLKYGWLIAPMAIALGLWYGLSVWKPPSYWAGRLTLQVPYYTIGWGIWFGLAIIHPVFMFILLVLFAHTYMYMWLPWSFVGAAILMGLTILQGVVDNGNLAPEAVLMGVTSSIAGGILAIFISAIITQSAQRHALLNELQRTRYELAIAEREAGILQERQRLAREIHDTLAQSFTSIVMNIEAAESKLASNHATASQHLGQAKQMARHSLQEARRWVWELRPEILEQKSFDEGIREVISSWEAVNGTKAALTVTGTPLPLAPEHEVALLRVVQEALSNVRKHAEAKAVNVTLSYMGDSVSLDILDDGKGFMPQHVERNHEAKSGFGLIGMRERVEQAGGTFLLESAKHEGTTIVVTLPNGDLK